MTITYTSNYVHLPPAGDTADQAQKGWAHEGYWAQVMARNLNYTLAYKAPPVLGSGYNTEGVIGNGTSSELLTFRGRAPLWQPFTDLTLVCRVKKNTLDGTVKIYATDTPWTGSTAGNNDVSGSASVTNSNFADAGGAKEIALASVPTALDGMVYWYITLTYCDMQNWVLFADPYSG
jgi:hypothetical protein